MAQQSEHRFPNWGEAGTPGTAGQPWAGAGWGAGQGWPGTGATGWGSQGPAGPPDQAAWGGPPPGEQGHWAGKDGSAPPRPPRRRLAIAAALVGTALVAGGAGAGIALAADQPGAGSPSTVPTAENTPAASSPAPGAPGQGLNVPAIASRVEPATVDITATGPNGQDEGTGMVITRSGLVLTNNHVIVGSTKLFAQVNGAGKKYPATVVGTSPTDDVALLQLHGGSAFSTVSIGNSSQVAVGAQVVAIGNALALQGPETVTDGIIAATSRTINVGDPATGTTETLKGVFQTTAPINPGNSGGPLTNSAGQVIGMNTAAATGSATGTSASNVGFAIPIDHAMAIVNQIEAGKASPTVFIGPHAIMGVTVESVACAEGQVSGCYPLGSNGLFGGPFGFSTYSAPTQHGAVVAGVEPGSPAAGAGLAVGDVITAVDGRSVANLSDLSHQLTGKKVGQAVTVKWLNPGGSAHSARLQLEAGPAL